MTQSTEESKAILEGKVIALVKVVAERVVSRITDGFHFNKVKVSDIEDVVASIGKFIHKNPVGMQMIHNILDETTYYQSYEEIGNILYEKMPDDMKERAEGMEQLETPQALGRKIIESNLIALVIQHLDGFFSEYDFHAVNTVAKIEMEKYDAEVDEVHKLMNKVIHKRASYFERHYTTNVKIGEMTFQAFHKYFDAKANLDGTLENAIGNHTIKKLMGRKGAELSASIVSMRVNTGDIHPMQLMMEMDEIANKIIFELMLTTLAVYHYSIVHAIAVDDVDVQAVLREVAQ